MDIMSKNEVADVIDEVFNFDVVKMPLSGPDNLSTPFYGLFRDDTMEIVNDSSVSKRYVPHDTEDVKALADAAIDAFDDEMKVRCHFRKGHYLELTPTDDFRHGVYGTQDNVFPRVIIKAGYDGKAFTSTMGMYRDQCQNLMMLDQVSGTSVSFRHTSNLRPKMNELIKTFDVLKNSWANLTTVVDHLENTRVNMVDFLNEIYGDAPTEQGRGRTVHENRTRAIFERLSGELMRTGRAPVSSANNFEVSSWMAYNAVQGYVQHDATRKKNATAFDRIILAGNDKAVRKAQTLAMAAVA